MLLGARIGIKVEPTAQSMRSVELDPLDRLTYSSEWRMTKVSFSIKKNDFCAPWGRLPRIALPL